MIRSLGLRVSPEVLGAMASKLTPEAFRAALLISTHLDDDGRSPANLAWLRAHPFAPIEGTDADAHRWLGALEAAGVVTLTEHGGRVFLRLEGWRSLVEPRGKGPDYRFVPRRRAKRARSRPLDRGEAGVGSENPGGADAPDATGG